MIEAWRPRSASSAIASAQGEAERATAQVDLFRLVMLPHMDAAYSFARYLARDTQRAEDIVQDAFLRAFRSFDTWRGDSAKAWLYTIVRNCFLASTTDPHWPSTESTLDGSPAIEPRDPEAIAMACDEAAMLRRTIEGLPQPFRETLILRELEEMPYKDIALLTDVPIGTVMSRLARARRMLAELLLVDARGVEARHAIRGNMCQLGIKASVRRSVLTDPLSTGRV
jgi:RNA polymerase sigma-70 factor (ECF subfamily)